MPASDDAAETRRRAPARAADGPCQGPTTDSRDAGRDAPGRAFAARNPPGCPPGHRAHDRAGAVPRPGAGSTEPALTGAWNPSRGRPVMAIVSGIDFSPNSLAAAEAAAAIARRLGDELVLVHADAFLADLPESGRIAWLEPVRERLR